jgi:hypothetical protein
MTEEQTEKEESESEQEIEEENEEVSDMEFIQSVIRAPRQGTYEQFLCQLLAQSVICTDPLKRIKIVAETANTVKEPEREKLNIDYEKIQVLNVVANAFLNPAVHNDRYLSDGIVSVSWGFLPSEENFKKYIVQWYNIFNLNFWPLLLRAHAKICHDSFNRPFVKEIYWKPEWSLFFDASDCLTPIGFNKLKNAFIAWASPQAQQYLAELTGAVDQNTYREILGLYAKPGRKGYAEKVKETAKRPETSTNENMVDS